MVTNSRLSLPSPVLSENIENEKSGMSDENTDKQSERIVRKMILNIGIFPDLFLNLTL